MELRNRSDLSMAEVAMAFELRQEGCCFKRIAEGMHIDPLDLMAELVYRVKAGTGTGRETTGPAFKTPIKLLQSAHAMRRCSMGWTSIGAHFYMPREQLRLAYNRALKLGWII